MERNHGYHNKMNPGIALTLRCNHDVGIMPKLPVLTPEQSAALMHGGASCEGEVASAVEVLEPLVGDVNAEI